MERILLLEDDKSLVAACAAALAVHGPVKRLQAMPRVRSKWRLRLRLSFPLLRRRTKF